MAMEISIKGHSDGKIVNVTNDHQLQVQSEFHELQHYMAIKHGQSYQIEGIDSGITATTQTILHIKNVDPVRKAVLSYIRLQAVTGGTYPSVGEKWEMGLGDTIASGGTSEVSINTHPSSGNTALIEATQGSPTMNDTMAVMDTQWPESNGKEITYNKHGSIILGLNDTFSIRYTSASTGSAKARITVMMDDEVV
jgi:hypothetical protein